MDVCPFVPVANVTMDDCVQCSKEFGKTLAEELNIPVYLYENSSQRSHRKKLPDIREGEYKGLPKKVIILLLAVYLNFPQIIQIVEIYFVVSAD